MGKRHFKGNNSSQDRKRRREHAEKWKNSRGDENRNSWVTITENARMEAFYKAQHFVDNGDDWTQFVTALRAPLPACFRISPDFPFAGHLREQLLEFMGEKLEVDGVEINPVEQIKWYPNGCGYKLGTDRRSIRKLPALNTLHKWMVQHTENGNITRQEAVSMVPPIALAVEPHHKCLDVCAAPGSKTSQLLEVVNRSLKNPAEQQGLVVANDCDTDRAYMLVHQCKRINSPLLVVTTHKGQLFPTIRENEQQFKSEYFDRVLCDVPCSGDGTLRKNPTIWSKWNTSMGSSLHPLQLMIANRGLQVLKAGGLMVYSTCSMSPYENESVIAELLRTHKGKLELVDARQFLPLFKARLGLTTWNVLDDFPVLKKEMQAKKAARTASKQTPSAAVETSTEGTMEVTEPQATTEVEAGPVQDFSHIQDAELRACLEMGMLYFEKHEDVPEHLNWKFRKSLFPPSKEELEWMHLERCLRCVPQDEDTGGFFVATLRKVGSESDNTTQVPLVSAEEEEKLEKAAAEAEGTEGDAEVDCECDKDEEEEEKPKQEKKQREDKGANRGLVEFQPWDVDTFQRIKEFYGFDEHLPLESFFIREDMALKARGQLPTASKTIYYIPHSTRTLINGDVNKQLKVVTAGIKCFEKKVSHNGDIDYRLLQEGIEFLADHIHSRKVNVSIQDFCNILGGGLVSYSTLSGNTISQLQTNSCGVVICVYDYSPEDFIAPQEIPEEGTATVDGTAQAITLGKNIGAQQAQHRFHVVCWRGLSRTINVMCGKVDIESIKHQLAALNVLRPKVFSSNRSDAAFETLPTTESIPVVELKPESETN